MSASHNPGNASQIHDRVASRSGWPLRALVVGVVLLLMTWLGGWLWGIRQTGAAAVPAVATSGLDPAVRRLIEDSLAVVRRSPRSGAAWGKLGSVLMHYEFREEAQTAFDRAERLSPNEPRWPYLHGLMRMGQDPEVALKKLGRAAALCPIVPDAPSLRFAQFLAEQGRDSEAERGFNGVLSRRPAHAPALLGLARLRHRQGRATECTNLLAGCLVDAHTAKAAHVLLAMVEQGAGNAAGATRASGRSAALPADRPWPDPFWEEAYSLRVGRKAWLEAGSALLDQGQGTEAAGILSRVAATYPEDDEAWYLLGWAFNREQRGTEAEKALREHLLRAPQSAKGHAQLAVALLGQQRPAEAATVLQRALAIKPTWRELHFNLGYAWVQLGQDEPARGCFRRALELDPNYLPTYTALAELELRRGENTGARQLLRQALELDPEDERVRDLVRRVEQGTR